MSSIQQSASNRDIVGKWQLVSFLREEEATGKKINFLGEHPKGFIIYTTGGRMMAVLTGETWRHHLEDDESRSDVQEHVIAYSGLYRIENNTVIHDVDVSWIESVMRMKLTRFFKLEDDTLTLNTALDENSAPGKDVTDFLLFRRAA